MAIKPSGDEPPKWSLLNNKICQDSAPASPGAQQQRSQVLRVRGGGMLASDWSASPLYSPLIGCWETQCSTGSDWAESRETWVLRHSQSQPGPADTGQYWPLIGHTGHNPGLWLADGETRACDQTQTHRLKFRPLTAWGAGQLRGVSTFLIRRVWSHLTNLTQSRTLHLLTPMLLTRPRSAYVRSPEAVLCMWCQGCDRTFYPSLCPVSAHHGYCYCPEEQLFTLYKTHPGCSVPCVCWLLSQIKTLLATNTRTETPMAPVWRPGPPSDAAPSSGLKRLTLPAMAGPVAIMAAIPSPAPATQRLAPITLLAMDASLQLKSTFPSHKSQF